MSYDLSNLSYAYHNKRYLRNGKITLEEPPVKTKSEVMVTFLSGKEENKSREKQKIILGMLEDKIKLPDDFHEPLDDLKDYI
ncbi:MAG: DUF2281 domain-containing protein [Parafilimonas sp.]